VEVGCPFLKNAQLGLIMERLVCYIFLNLLFSPRELNTNPKHVADFSKLSSMP